MAAESSADGQLFAPWLEAAVQSAYITAAQKATLLAWRPDVIAHHLVGCPIIVHGLKAMPELNACHGWIAGEMSSDSGRYPVAVHTAQNDRVLTKALRTINLLPAPAVDLAAPLFFTPSEKDDFTAQSPAESAAPTNASSSADAAAAPTAEAARAAEAAPSMPSAEGERMCRICMSDESEVELTRPCACRGSLAYACTDCIVHAAVAAWEGAAAEPKRCKQCMQEYGTSLRLAITRAQAAKASAHADEAGDLNVRQGWLDEVAQCETELACVALVEHGRELGHASPAGRACLEEAIERTRQEVAKSVEAQGAASHHTLARELCLGEVMRYSRRLEEAAALHRKTLGAIQACRCATAPPPTEAVAMELSILEEDAHSHLGNCLTSLGRYDEAEALLRTSLELCNAMRVRNGRYDSGAPSDNRRAIDSLARCLGKRLDDRGKLREAEVLARQSWALRARQWGREHSDTLVAARLVERLRSLQCRAICEAMVAKAVKANGGVAQPDERASEPSVNVS